MIGNYVIVRTYSAGVFAGTLQTLDRDKAELHNARRLWYWAGAASLSQLAMEGTKKPEKCKFPCEVEKVWLLGVIEILQVSDKAKTSIFNVPEWRAAQDA